MTRVAVLGAGAWGTAMACVLAGRHQVELYARDPEQARSMQSARCNARYLPGFAFPDALEVVDDLASAVRRADGGLIIIATPTRALRDVFGQLAEFDTRSAVAWLCKGFEETEHLLAHEVLARVWPEAVDRCGPVSGPSFAFEVARGLPTALTVAGEPRFCDVVTATLHGAALRIYSSSDVVGVEVGGTVKNVLAIATGISDALRARPERARRADHPRAGGDDAPRRRAGRPSGDLHGPDRRRRPDTDGDRRPFAQPPGRSGPRARPQDHRHHRKPRPCRRGRPFGPRSAGAGTPGRRCRCRSPRPSSPCWTAR